MNNIDNKKTILWQFFLPITISIIGMIITIFLSYKTLKETRIIKSAEFMLEFNKELNEKTIYNILDRASNNLPILINNGGPYTSNDLNDVLGIFEDINIIKQNNILTEDMIYEWYDDDLESICGNKEFQNYIKSEQSKDQELWSGVINLGIEIIPNNKSHCQFFHQFSK